MNKKRKTECCNKKKISELFERIICSFSYTLPSYGVVPHYNINKEKHKNPLINKKDEIY